MVDPSFHILETKLQILVIVLLEYVTITQDILPRNYSWTHIKNQAGLPRSLIVQNTDCINR